jgi:coproporphyrinogen III oxidase-like Fe-S oxidoreductase
MICSADDIERREIIKQLMCNNFAIINLVKYAHEFRMLQEFFVDKLLDWTYHDLTNPEEVLLEVTDLGRYFTRNIASVFDTHIRSQNAHKIFSRSL